MSALTHRLAVSALAGVAAATLLGCQREVADYPAGWAPLVVASRHHCPDVRGDYLLDPSAGRDAALGELARPPFAPPDLASITPDLVRVSNDAHGRLDVSFARRPQAGAPIDWQHYAVDVGAARCDSGWLEIERHDTRGGWTALRLGKDTDGRLVAQRLDNRSSPLLRWGDSAGFLSTRATHASWGRWTPGDVADAAADRPGSLARRAAAPAPAPAVPTPAPPPLRPGSMALGEAQAIVFAALPDSAIFRGMTATPDGYELHVATEDPHAMERLTQRLLKEGHFAVRPDARFASTTASAPASDASAPEPAPAPTRTGADLTLELVERGLR